MKRLLLVLWRMSKADVRMLWYALRHPKRPAWLIPVTAVLTLYALNPLNLTIPILGVVDDLVIVPMLLHFLVSRLPEHLHREHATSRKPSPL